MAKTSYHAAVTIGSALPTSPTKGSPDGFYVGVAGDVAIEQDSPAGPVMLVYKNMAAGVFHPCSPLSIGSVGQGTTATDIIVVWSRL